MISWTIVKVELRVVLSAKAQGYPKTESNILFFKLKMGGKGANFTIDVLRKTGVKYFGVSYGKYNTSQVSITCSDTQQRFKPDILPIPVLYYFYVLLGRVFPLFSKKCFFEGKDRSIRKRQFHFFWVFTTKYVVCSPWSISVWMDISQGIIAT